MVKLERALSRFFSFARALGHDRHALFAGCPTAVGSRLRAPWAGACALALTLAGGGCARSKTLVVDVAPDVNGGFAIAMDLVIVRNVELASELGTMSASDFASAKMSLQSRYGPAMEVHSCEWPPGVSVSPWLLPNRRQGKGRKTNERKQRGRAAREHYSAFVFAHYPSPDDNSSQLDGFLDANDAVVVELGAEALEVDVQASVGSAGVEGFPCVQPKEEAR